MRSLRFGLLAGAGCLMLLTAAGVASAQSMRNGYFVHEFWAELEPMAGGLLSGSGPNAVSPTPAKPLTGTSAGPSPLPRNQAITDILKEAQYVYSGMIYGFSFTYTPADPRRKIAGSFELTPIAEIKWGDPRLRVLDTRVEKSRLIARVMYSLEPFQKVWTEGWDSNVYPTATGRGVSRYFLSYSQKMASYKDAMKEAIRHYLEQRIYNRPHRVIGQLVLRGSPYTIIDAGQYVTTLTVKLRIDKIEPYSIY